MIAILSSGSVHLMNLGGGGGGADAEGRRPRGEKRPTPEGHKDDKYFERRKRNNQAAKKSRDARKFREDQVINQDQSIVEDTYIIS